MAGQPNSTTPKRKKRKKASTTPRQPSATARAISDTAQAINNLRESTTEAINGVKTSLDDASKQTGDRITRHEEETSKRFDLFNATLGQTQQRVGKIEEEKKATSAWETRRNWSTSIAGMAAAAALIFLTLWFVLSFAPEIVSTIKKGAAAITPTTAVGDDKGKPDKEKATTDSKSKTEAEEPPKKTAAKTDDPRSWGTKKTSPTPPIKESEVLYEGETATKKPAARWTDSVTWTPAYETPKKWQAKVTKRTEQKKLSPPTTTSSTVLDAAVITGAINVKSMPVTGKAEPFKVCPNEVIKFSHPNGYEVYYQGIRPDHPPLPSGQEWVVEETTTFDITEE